MYHGRDSYSENNEFLNRSISFARLTNNCTIQTKPASQEYLIVKKEEGLWIWTTNKQVPCNNTMQNPKKKSQVVITSNIDVLVEEKRINHTAKSHSKSNSLQVEIHSSQKARWLMVSLVVIVNHFIRFKLVNIWQKHPGVFSDKLEIKIDYVEHRKCPKIL